MSRTLCRCSTWTRRTGEPARFGFEIRTVPVVLDTAVRTGGDYGVTVSVSNATEAAQVLGAQVTFWGAPGHAKPRPLPRMGVPAGRRLRSNTKANPAKRPARAPRSPFLTLADLLHRAVEHVDAKATRGRAISSEQANTLSRTAWADRWKALKAAETLPFDPSIEVQPEQQAEEGRPRKRTTSASTPTGLSVDVKVAQQGTLEGGGLGDADVKDDDGDVARGRASEPRRGERPAGVLGGAGRLPRTGRRGSAVAWLAGTVAVLERTGQLPGSFQARDGAYARRRC